MLEPMKQSSESSEPLATAQSFSQMFQLNPMLALFVILTDCMVSVVDVASLGITAPFLWLVASLFVGVIVFLGQKKWTADDAESAAIKALIVAFLVALPTPFPAFLSVPSGVVGLVHNIRKGNSNE